MNDPRDAVKNAWTIGEMIEVLQQWPPHFRLDFSPGECEDVTPAAEVQVLEGDTSDGPGTVWLKLREPVPVPSARKIAKPPQPAQPPPVAPLPANREQDNPSLHLLYVKWACVMLSMIDDAIKKLSSASNLNMMGPIGALQSEREKLVRDRKDFRDADEILLMVKRRAMSVEELRPDSDA